MLSAEQATQLARNSAQSIEYLIGRAADDIREQFVIPFCEKWGVDFVVTPDEWGVYDIEGNWIDEESLQPGAGWSAEWEAARVVYREHGPGGSLVNDPEFEQEFSALALVLNYHLCPGVPLFTRMESFQI